MTVASSLIEYGHKYCLNTSPADIRVGLGFTCVELSDGMAGVAWTPQASSFSCTRIQRAGKLLEQKERDTLDLLVSDSSIERAIGLAAFNAVNARVEYEADETEAISRLEIKPSDHVVMVGNFAPLVPRIKKTGCTLDILELNPDKRDVTRPHHSPEILSQCDIAIITATSIITDTIDELLPLLERNRAAVMLGPSTPLCPDLFERTRLTQLSGSRVLNTKKIKQIVSQGGGTKIMKKHLQFINIDVE